MTCYDIDKEKEGKIEEKRWRKQSDKINSLVQDELHLKREIEPAAPTSNNYKNLIKKK